MDGETRIGGGRERATKTGAASSVGHDLTDRYSPIVARTRTTYRPTGPAAYDCVEVIVIRDGSAVLFGEFGQQPVNVGDVVLLAANVLCGCEPEGHLTASTVFLDSDYVIDQVRWQRFELFQDRLDARDFADRVLAEPAQVLRLGEDRAGMLMPWLDELVGLSVDGRFAKNYYRMQAAWFRVVHVIEPYVKVAPVRIPSSQRAHICPVLPRTRRFEPLRAEARQVAELLRAGLTVRWSLNELAARVHLSRSQVSRVFTAAYGKTPLAYLTMLRAEQLARLLRDTDLPIESAMRQVGWHSRGHAARLFRQYIGMSPSQYRQISASRPES